MLAGTHEKSLQVVDRHSDNTISPRCEATRVVDRLKRTTQKRSASSTIPLFRCGAQLYLYTTDKHAKRIIPLHTVHFSTFPRSLLTCSARRETIEASSFCNYRSSPAQPASHTPCPTEQTPQHCSTSMLPSAVRPPSPSFPEHLSRPENCENPLPLDR